MAAFYLSPFNVLPVTVNNKTSTNRSQLSVKLLSSPPFCVNPKKRLEKKKLHTLTPSLNSSE